MNESEVAADLDSGRAPVGHHASAKQAAKRLPGPVTADWPKGEPFARALSHGSMSVELYVPAEVDTQQPHVQDELYVIERGKGRLRIADAFYDFEAGDVLFVPAGTDHRFETFSADFRTWVIFWGPPGGEP